MAFSKERLQKRVSEAMAAVFEDCSAVAPAGAFAKNTPADAWIIELLSFASYIAEADGRISKTEVNALREMFSNAGAGVSKNIMKIMALSLSQSDLDIMPYEIDAVIAKDNERLAAGSERVPSSIQLACLYYWTAEYITEADGKSLPVENAAKLPVLERIFEKLKTELELPQEETKRLFFGTLNSIKN